MTLTRQDLVMLHGRSLVTPEDRAYLLARAESTLVFLRLCGDPSVRRDLLHGILCVLWAESRAEAKGHEAWAQFLLDD